MQFDREIVEHEPGLGGVGEGGGEGPLKAVTVLIEDRGDLVDEVFIQICADAEEGLDPEGCDIFVLAFISSRRDLIHIVETGSSG